MKQALNQNHLIQGQSLHFPPLPVPEVEAMPGLGGDGCDSLYKRCAAACSNFGKVFKEMLSCSCFINMGIQNLLFFAMGAAVLLADYKEQW